jgi:hypothetical protein
MRRLQTRELVAVERGEPNAEIIAELEQALKDARAGYIRGFACISIQQGTNGDGATVPVVAQFFSSNLQETGLFNAIAGLRLLSRDVEDLAERDRDGEQLKAKPAKR